MNLEIFNNDDPSGKLTRESYIIKNHAEEYDFVIKFCNENNFAELSFKEKVYLSINNIKRLPVCKNPICKNPVKFKSFKEGYRNYCSIKCVSSDPEVIKLKEEKSIEKYGTKSPSQSELIREKIIKTNNEKYGGNSPLSSEYVREKSKQTLIKNYGIDNPSRSEEILKKRVLSFKEGSFKENYRKTSMLKYGVSHPWMYKTVHLKTVESTNNSKKLNLKNKILKILEENTQYSLVHIDYDVFKREIKIFCNNCKEIFKINREDLHYRNKFKIFICTICNPINSKSSGSELELLNFIKSNYDGDVITNKKIIPPYEIDIYLPELKIGFEFNGLYWHSESQRGKNYHSNKTKICEKNDIQLIHVWEDDWVYKNDIVKSIILYKLGKIKNKIFSRKCEIREIDANRSLLFLNTNHIQGYSHANIKLGLFLGDELVSLMTFKKISNKSYELSRFCNVINTLVIGASSKLFKFFLKKYNPNEIITYSDNSIFKGEVYERLGFYYGGDSAINYKWVIGKRRMHKSNFRKNKLKKLGYDIKKSENEIVIEDIGGYKIWDCGLKKWIYKF